MTIAILAATCITGAFIPWAIRHDQEQPISHTGKAAK